MRKTRSDIFLIFLVLSTFSVGAAAQQQHLPFNNGYYRDFEEHLYGAPGFHTSIKPYRAADVYLHVFPDTTWAFKRLKASEKFFPRAANVLFFEHLLEFSEDGYVRKSVRDTVQPGVTIRRNYTDTAYVARRFHITANPFIRLEYGYDNVRDGSVGYNKRGVVITADIGQKLSIFTSFSENQAKFPQYLDPQIRSTRVIPGEGKARNFGAQSFDFANIWAYIHYAPNKYISLEAGNGKHFIGDGYRSLLLSDNAYVYPYAKATVSFWRFRYQIIYAELQNDIRARTDFATGVTRKFANFNYLSAEFTPWLQVGLFEGILWRRTTPGGQTAFDYNFLNPVIGIRGLQKGLDANTVYGLNYKFTLPLHIILYGQWMLDKFPTDGLQHINNRMGLQAGVKYYDVGGVDNLHFQAEYNRVRPYAYAAGDSLLHYTQYDQPLAHPLGANFHEVYGRLDYRFDRFYTSLSMAWSRGGLDILLVDSTGVVDGRYTSGSEIMLPDWLAPSESDIGLAGGPARYSLLHTEFRVGAIVNPKINLKVELGLTLRRTTTDLLAEVSPGNFQDFSLTENNRIFTVSVSTRIFNNYYDNIPRLSVLPFNP